MRGDNPALRVRIYQGLESIGNGQAPGTTTGRGAIGAGLAAAAGRRAAGFFLAGALFAAWRFEARRAGLRAARFFFFFTAFFPPDLRFALAIDASCQ